MAFDPTSDEYLTTQKEGAPLNSPTPTDLPAPTCLWNATEDHTLPMDPDNSLASRVCDLYLDEECKECQNGRKAMMMASTTDLCLKEYSPDTYERDVYQRNLDVTFSPVDASNFPNVRSGVWTQTGYATLIQPAEIRPGGLLTKLVNRVGVEFDCTEQEPPGKLAVQLGTANTPARFNWDAAHQAKNLDTEQPDDTVTPVGNVKDLRPARPVTYAFFRSGVWLACRIYVTDSANDPAPVACPVSVTSMAMSAKIENKQWTNQ